MTSQPTTLERRAMVGLLVGIHVMLAVVNRVLFWATNDGEITPFETVDEAVQAVVWNVAYSVQISLVAAWLAIGRAPFAIRFPVTLLACTLLLHDKHPTYWWFIVGMIAHVAVVTIPLLACRFRGLRVRVEGETALENIRRFEIWHLLALTGGLAVIFALWKLWPLRTQKLEWLERADSLVLLGLDNVLVGAITVVAVWACLARGDRQFRLAVLLAASLLATLLMYLGATRLRPLREALLFWSACGWTLLHAPWMCVTLLILRWCGYFVEFLPAGESAVGQPVLDQVEQPTAPDGLPELRAKAP